MKTATIAHVVAIAGGLASVAGLIYVVTRDSAPPQPDPLVGRLVRIPIAAAAQTTLPDFPIAGLKGSMIVRVTSVTGERCTALVVSFDGFDTVLGRALPPGLEVQFSKGAIQP